MGKQYCICCAEGETYCVQRQQGALIENRSTFEVFREKEAERTYLYRHVQHVGSPGVPALPRSLSFAAGAETVSGSAYSGTRPREPE